MNPLIVMHLRTLAATPRTLLCTCPSPSLLWVSARHSHSTSASLSTHFSSHCINTLRNRQSHPQPRHLHASAAISHTKRVPLDAPNALKVVFVTPDDDVVTVGALEGQNLLDVAHANDIDLEGACEGSLACSTCHVVVEDAKLYARMEEPSDEENDMLDLAFGLSETSRLGCQVAMCKDLDGIRVRIPSATRNVSHGKLNAS